MKRPERLRRSLRLAPVELLESRALLTMAVTAPLPDLSLTAGVASPQIDLTTHFNDPDAKTEFAIFDTTLGSIPVRLTPDTTPATVANFLNYVNKGSYANTVVHRSVPGFIWQAGGFQLTSTPTIEPIAADAAVKNEYGASNLRGTIAMAKLGNDPNSATNQFFFNESDTNASNLDNQNGGFTVFGKVVGADGLAVMDAIAGVPIPSPAPLASPLNQIPLQGYKAGTSIQPSNLILIRGITSTDELFLTSSDAPTVATATVQGGKLVVTPVAAGTAQITVAGYGSGGSLATETFTVHVGAGVSPPAGQPPSVTPAPNPVVIPPSQLTPAARGAIPASVVAGQRARIQQTVTLLAAAGPVSQRAQVSLRLSTSTNGTASDIAIAEASPRVKLKAGRQARLNLTVRKLDPAIPSGTYHVLVSVTDPDGARTTVDTGRTLIVQAS